jgi:hypothetical protein
LTSLLLPQKGIYELNTKLDFNCVYRIYNLKATPLCLDYWFDAANPNDSILIWGDTAGEVHTIHFNSTLIALFERPNSNVGSIKTQPNQNESCLNIELSEIKETYKNAMYISYLAHPGWVRQGTHQQIHFNEREKYPVAIFILSVLLYLKLNGRKI